MICDKCGEEKPDALVRVMPVEVRDRTGFTKDPALCARCCSDIPGREWMKDSPWVKNASGCDAGSVGSCSCGG